ncbi:hypothetical protein K227x_01050 [Rubripirellula lacrimiformis]|uniref:Secreted protein containing DUF1552 n=1 Tax=Rubripirellula lacrimiformis TaxID=1930273 RepID=A0A517N415_9BACT|nr:DUF1552 domain-containing protein [Rubripirellula lacrimiformis]QDT01738.1 hypothetical protein K227x_01050 [Rubripirellula lacrimiformis]
MPSDKRVQFNFRRALHRRTVLRGAGVSMSLPWLTAMQPSFASSAQAAAPKRFVAMTLGLGLVADNLFPKNDGRDYEASPYLKPLSDVREKLTVVSGVSHPGVKGGHRAEASILTASEIGSSGKAANSISIDQLMAKHLGDATRFPSLVLSTSGSTSPCYTESGAMIPPQDRPSRLFEKLFVDDPVSERAHRASQVRQGRSIMDLVGEDAKSLQRDLGQGDRDRLDAYFTSVRALERRMEETEKWAKRPKPKVDAKKPVDINNPGDLIGRQRTMCDVIKLALQTDSSRFVSLHIPGAGGVIPIEGVETAHHNLSHHGMDESKLEQLALVEGAIVAQWGEFIRDLNASQDGDQTLLDSTNVLLTSNLGNASNHDNRNMPVLLAGGGFRHAGHLAFDRKNNYPLPNLFVSLLQNVGLEIDQFATSTGTLNGLG